MTFLLGIDLGTSSVKALLMDVTGKTYGICHEQYPIEVPQEEWAEQSPDRWWSATTRVIRKLLSESGVEAERIRGVGLSGQMHGLVVLNRSGEPIRPAIIWSDQRAKKQVRSINDLLHEQQLAPQTMNQASAGFAAASLLWVKENEPEVFAAIDKVLLPKDYIRYKLTGRIACEATDASSTLAFNTRERQWCHPLIEALGLPPSIFPECFEPMDIAGDIQESAALETGLRRGTPVVFGGSDQTMQAVGNGVIEPGWVISNIGTGGQVSSMTAEPLYDLQWRLNTFCHVFKGSWVIQGSNLNSGLALKWLKENVLQTSDFNSLLELATRVRAGSEGVLFLPYLIGERTPHMDPNARACFFGMTLKHRKEHIVKAVVEGVVYALRSSLETIEEQGIKVDRILASGGGSKHEVWLQAQADIFGKPVYTTRIEEEACVGAAIIAGTGIGAYRSLAEGCRQAVSMTGRQFEPDPAAQPIYEHDYGLFQEVYARNKELFTVWTGKG